MANGDDLEQRIEDRLRLKQVEKEEEERDIEERVAARVGGGGPTYISGGSGIASALTAVGILAGVGGAGYYAYTKGFLSQFLGPVISGPKSIPAGGSYNYVVVGLTPGQPFEQDLILSDGSSKMLTPNPNAGPDGSAHVSLPIDSSIPAGLTQLRVTDLTTGKAGKKNFTVLGTSSSSGNGTGTGTGKTGTGTGLIATGDPAILTSGNYTVHVTGATPNNQVAIDLFPVSGVDLTLLPYADTDAKGAVDVAFNVGSNIGIGALKIQVTDIATGAKTILNTTVLPASV